MEAANQATNRSFNNGGSPPPNYLPKSKLSSWLLDAAGKRIYEQSAYCSSVSDEKKFDQFNDDGEPFILKNNSPYRESREMTREMAMEMSKDQERHDKTDKSDKPDKRDKKRNKPDKASAPPRD